MASEISVDDIKAGIRTCNSGRQTHASLDRIGLQEQGRTADA